MADDTPKKRHLRLVSNEDLQRILHIRAGSGNVSMLNPLELFMDREQLLTMTRQSMADIKRQRPADETPEQHNAVERALQQRIDFLAWLDTQPEQVYMAIYPSDIDGLDDLDDLLDLPTDTEQPDLPF